MKFCLNNWNSLTDSYRIEWENWKKKIEDKA